MNDDKHDPVSPPSAVLSRRQLLVGAAATGGLLATGTVTSAAPATTDIADPQLRAALQRYGGEFGQAGRATGGDHGDL